MSKWMETSKMIGVMTERIGKPAMYELLAEECTELAQAALKAARYLRDENPTDMDPTLIECGIREEFTDVFMCCADLSLEVDVDIWRSKFERFEERWKNAKYKKEGGEK